MAVLEVVHLLVADDGALGVGAWSSTAVTVSPVRVVAAAMVLTTTSWLVSGRPRQFRVMWREQPVLDLG